MFLGLVFELRHTTRFTKAGDGVQDPSKLRMGWHVRLDEQGGLVWVNSARNVLSGGLSGRRSLSLGVLCDRDGVKIHNTEHRIVGVLHLNPLQQCPCVISKVQGVRGGLHARKQPGSGHG